MVEDTARLRLYHCDQCGAMEVISKGVTSPAWWYHGAVRPDGSKISGGRRSNDGVWEWWLRQ
jgi:hypothetical protein